ncbi:sensor histidine kinase [Desulfopila aestuarii]|uniref:histidine kinase n=1 Tax=Desulfopila aestuarii DSM 18488 TaxID=1121416 RepID=A0A1M7YAK9_9BACT|nr:HAMP domain-containing sensor histidine kinase [Desulfopila aestuarii]SHO49606.1 Signal transduction histidine kinase [Desulfopila aestuarii DSM 18488]
MKLFYHLFGYLLFGMILLIGTDEYFNFLAEVDQFEKDMVSNAVQNGRSISAMIGHTWQVSGEKKAKELIQDASNSGTIGVTWVWVDELVADTTRPMSEQKTLQKVAAGETVSLKLEGVESEKYLYTYVPVDVGEERQGALELRQPLLPLKKFTRRMADRDSFITAVLALVCGLFLYYFIYWNIRLPLNRLTERARRIGQGDLTADLDIQGSDELADLARTMNDMCASLIIAREKIKFEYDARLKTLDQLRHTERLSTFGLISAGIAHEIGTPLNVVDGRAKMIMRDELNEAEIKECATIIKSQAERMTNIIRQLLDFTRRPRQQIAEENIILIIKQIFQLLYPMASRQRVEFMLNREEGAEVTLKADGAQIQQVLINLMMNSIQAMPDGGSVSISVSNEMLPSSQHSEDGSRSYLKIRIVDEGEGICKEDLEHIFTPFFTTKTIGTGTGLGLSIAHGIVEEHGGWINVESTVRSGACFSIYLPMQPSES